MEPLTRKARNTQDRVCRLLDTSPEDLRWELAGQDPLDKSKFMVAAIGDKNWDTIRWVQTQNDPDWKIV